MPNLAPKALPAQSFNACLGPSVGRTDDFWALAYCPERDDIERMTNPDHTAFTYVIHYQLPRRTLVARIPQRLDALLQLSTGKVLAAGNTQGYLEIDPTGAVEVSIPGVSGVFSSMWAASDDHVFAGGCADPFVYYRRHGQWQQLALPENSEDIRSICGFSEHDVYFVGPRGQVLHFDGHQINRVRVPYRTWLTGVATLNATEVCVSGYRGTLFYGNTRQWKYIATHSTEPILSVATLQKQAYYGLEEKVWVTDGIQPPSIVLDYDAVWASSLQDGLVFSGYTDAKLHSSSGTVDLDVSV